MTSFTFCPRCDKPPTLMSDYSLVHKMQLFGFTHECDAVFPRFYVECRETFTKKELAIDAWNTFIDEMKNKKLSDI